MTPQERQQRVACLEAEIRGRKAAIRSERRALAAAATELASLQLADGCQALGLQAIAVDTTGAEVKEDPHGRQAKAAARA